MAIYCGPGQNGCVELVVFHSVTPKAKELQTIYHCSWERSDMLHFSFLHQIRSILDPRDMNTSLVCSTLIYKKQLISPNSFKVNFMLTESPMLSTYTITFVECSWVILTNRKSREYNNMFDSDFKKCF